MSRPYVTPRDPALRRHAPDVAWTLLDALWVHDRPLTVWMVPQGYRCDLASVPHPLWGIIAPQDLCEAPAIAHDYLYQRGGVVNPHLRYTRAEADALFRDLMAWYGVPWAKRWAAWLAVRTRGGAYWRAGVERKAAA